MHKNIVLSGRLLNTHVNTKIKKKQTQKAISNERVNHLLHLELQKKYVTCT